MRKILLVAFQVESRSNGGLESATRIFEALADHYDWSFVTTRESGFTERWRRRGADVKVVPFRAGGSLPAKIASYARWTGRILATAANSGVDCIHANDLRAYKAASLPARLLGVPLLLTIRDTKEDGESYGHAWHHAARQCARIVTLSDEMGRTIAAATGASREKLRTINSVVDLARFAVPSIEERAAARSSIGISDREFAIGSIGAVREKKNQLELIEKTLPALFRGSSDARLHIFGDFNPHLDRYAADCSAAVRRLGIEERVVFHGHRGDMAETLKALDAIVVSARNEGLARAMIEGMACGVPVVSFAVCSAHEMLDDPPAGVVLMQGDHDGLANALIRLALDPKARFVFGRNGRAIAEQRFNVQRIRADYRALYDEVVAAGGVA